MTTRDEMIQTVRRIVTSYNVDTNDMMSVEIVDALHPRQRNSVPLPDGGRMEWRSGGVYSWLRFNMDGTLNDACITLAAHKLPDDLHAQCYALKNREWVEDEIKDDAELPALVRDWFRSLSKAWPYLTDHANHIDGEFDNAHRSLKNWAIGLYADRKQTQATPAPTNATPLGFVNRFGDNEWSHIYQTQREARFDAVEGVVETAVPVYRHAQTEAELVAALEECGYTRNYTHIEGEIWFAKRAGGGA